MTSINEPYVLKSVAMALADFDNQAGPGNINDLLFALCCRLLELSHAAPGVYSETQAETDATSRAQQLGHDAASIRATWRSAEKTTRGKAAAIPPLATQNGHAPANAGYADLAAYAASRGVPAEVFERAGWRDAELYTYTYVDRRTGKQETGLTDDEPLQPQSRRRAVQFDTDAGPRWRLLDGGKPKYWHRPGTHLDSNKTWYRVVEALNIANATPGLPLVLVNGEASVIVAQTYGIPATCETGGGEKATPPGLVQLIQAFRPGLPVLIALDCDPKGQKAAQKKREQYQQSGFPTRAIDLNLGHQEDIADFCRLHQDQSMARLLACADLPGPAPQAGQPAPVQKPQSLVIIEQLAQLGYTFKLNLAGHIPEVSGQPMTDVIAAEIRTKLRDLGWKRFGAVEDAYVAHAAANAYHPVREYLTSLAWDGQSRIATLAACIQGDNPTVVYRDGATRPLTEVYLSRWLIGAVAKALHGSQNAMLVFAGKQGMGKSQFAWWLCPPTLRAQHFLEAPINPTDKDSLLRLMQQFIWEVGELDATTRKADVSALKHFISQETVTVRRSYGRYDIRGPALASMIGTVNGSEFLADDTGNRRFFVLDFVSFDWAYRQIDIDQLWAEAVAAYQSGVAWRLTDEETTAQEGHNRGYLAEGIIADYIRKYLWVTHDPAHELSAADILDILHEKNVRLSGTDRALAMDIGRAMAALGVPKRRKPNGGARVYVGIVAK